ncbi:hypothetical protein AgCh_039704 [Apium graveolens]
MASPKRFEMKIMLSIVLLISSVANGAEDGTCNLYDRRGLTENVGSSVQGAVHGAVHGAAAHGAAAMSSVSRAATSATSSSSKPATSMKADVAAPAAAGAPAGAAPAAGGAPGAAPGGAPGPDGAVVFDVSKCPNAKGDGQTDVTQSVLKAWNDACHSTSTAKVLIPEGEWLTAELDFAGPCTAPLPIIVEIQGTLKAKPDAKSFPSGMWINIFQTGVKLMGGGTIDGQGCEAWKTKKPGGDALPDSLCITQCNVSSAENINILNSKGFNMKVVESDDFVANNLKITCAGDSPNTDGIHIGKVKNLKITNSVIGVGDDCISIGDDSTDVTITNITCGPGHGISIGSLGRYPDEKDVKNVLVSNCTFLNTTNGARIKTMHESPTLSAMNITFQDIIVQHTFNPIIIDQHYFADKPGPSKVKVSGVTFKNFKGTSLSNVAVSLNCSEAAPCEGINLADIDFTYTGNNTNTTLGSECANAKATFGGKMMPAGCAI